MYCAKHLPQHAGIPGWLGTPVPCGSGGTVPGIWAIEELGGTIKELEELGSGTAEEVLGAGAALPVLPKQKDWTQPK